MEDLSKFKLLMAKKKLEELEPRKGILETYSGIVLKRYEFMNALVKNMKDLKTFIANKDFKSDDFYAFKFVGLKVQIDLEKQLQEEYLRDSQVFIKNKISEIQELFRNREKDENEMSVYEDFMHQYDVLNRQTLLKSMLYENYSYLESKLKEICNIIERKESRSLKTFTNKTEGSYLDIYRKFLTGDELDLEVEVVNMNSYRIIRNYLMHETASFRSVQNDVELAIASNSFLHLKNRQIFIVHEDYITDLIKCIHSYLELIFDKLRVKNK